MVQLLAADATPQLRLGPCQLAAILRSPRQNHNLGRLVRLLQVGQVAFQRVERVPQVDAALALKDVVHVADSPLLVPIHIVIVVAAATDCSGKRGRVTTTAAVLSC